MLGEILAGSREKAPGLTLRYRHLWSARLITASPDHIKALWMNLLANAIQYTPDGGQVGVRTCKQTPRTNVLTATITDTGIGIAAEEIPRIFEEFYRTGEAARTMQETGTGLGLPIVQQIVTMYGGTLEIESVVSRGSTFRFMLPVF